MALLGVSGSLATEFTDGCGTEKQCFLVPEGCSGSACDYAVTFTPRGSYIDFVVGTDVSALGDDAYIAVGAGPNPTMDGGSVMECIHFGDTLTTQLSYNVGYENDPIPDYVIEAELDLSLSSGDITDGFLECSFSRKADGIGTDGILVDLNSPNEYYITVARGTASSETTKDYHGADKVVSTSTYDFMAPIDSV